MSTSPGPQDWPLFLIATSIAMAPTGGPVKDWYGGGQHPALDELEVGEGAADDDGRRRQGVVDLRQ